jgi:hypothetical protein
MTTTIAQGCRGAFLIEKENDLFVHQPERLRSAVQVLHRNRSVPETAERFLFSCQHVDAFPSKVLTR